MKESNPEMPPQWDKALTQVFWGEIAPCDHLIQIYKNDHTFLNTLEGFTVDGLARDESVIVIATPDHLDHLHIRLQLADLDVENLMSNDQYLPIHVEESLGAFMVNGWPDEVLFLRFVTGLIRRAQKNGRKVRVFGEIVAVLWAKGHNGATVRLEHMWHRFQQKELFCLYCAYPKSGFTQDANASIANLCKAHSKVIDGEAYSSTEIYYKMSE